MATKFFLSLFFAGLLIVSVLLATGHYGFAIKVTNYLFWLIFAAVFGIFLYEKK